MLPTDENGFVLFKDIPWDELKVTGQSRKGLTLFNELPVEKSCGRISFIYKKKSYSTKVPKLVAHWYHNAIETGQRTGWQYGVEAMEEKISKIYLPYEDSFLGQH